MTFLDDVIHLPSGRLGTIVENGGDMVLVSWGDWESWVPGDTLRYTTPATPQEV